MSNASRLKTRLDLMSPGLGGKGFDKRSDQKSRIDKGSKERDFTIGEQVLLRNFRGQPKWLDGTVTELTGSVYYYKVLVVDQLWKRHVDRIHQNDNSNVQIVAQMLADSNLRWYGHGFLPRFYSGCPGLLMWSLLKRAFDTGRYKSVIRPIH